MRHAAVALFVPLGLAAGVAGCSYPPLDRIPVPQEIKDLPVRATHDLDLLFLVDDSPSMADKQLNLASNFPRFLDALATLPGGLPSVHIGVATSDLGVRGADGMPPGPAIGTIGQGGCSGVGKDGVLQLFSAGAQVSGAPFVSDVASPDGTRLRNYTGNLSDVFAGMAKAGAGGCGFEQSLEAIRRALDPSNAPNAGFLRPDALLGVILITDEDDCSLQHATLLGTDPATLGAPQSFRCTRFGITCDGGGQTPDAMNAIGTKTGCHPDDQSAYLTKVGDHAAFLKSLKVDPSKVIVAALAGPTEPFATELRAPAAGAAPIPALAHSCTYTGGDGKPEVADPPVRIKAFLDAFPDRSAFAPICQQDLSGGLAQFGSLVRTALGDPCIAGTLADTDPRTPGPQYECDVEVTEPRQTRRTALPRCSTDDATAGNRPCWHIALDAASCPAGDHLGVKIEGLDTLSATAHVIASCTIVPPA
jgi:hypothetical protein